VSYIIVRRLKFSAIILRHLVPWPSVELLTSMKNVMGIVPGEPLRRGGGLKARGVAKYSDLSNAISQKRCKIGGKLVLITKRKSYMSFRLVSKSVTLNDLERRNGRYLELFQRLW